MVASTNLSVDFIFYFSAQLCYMSFTKINNAHYLLNMFVKETLNNPTSNVAYDFLYELGGCTQ